VQRSDVVREALMRAFFRHPQAMSGIVKRDNETQEPAAAANGSSRGHDDSSH
jgi:hypothetical protein